MVVPASGKISLSAKNKCAEFVVRNLQGVCPTWFFQSSEDGKEYECGPDFNKATHCHYHSNSTTLNIAYCMTYNETSKLTFVGQCPYNTFRESKLFHKLPKNVEQLNEKMCGPLNRTGLLCSQCQQGLGPAVFSPYRECVECMDTPYGWILFFFTRFRGSWELKGSVINAFVTFLLLSYSKICSISFSLMQSVKVSDICDYHSYRVYYDMSYERLSKHHLHYVIPASIVVIVLVCLPALFVLFYQNKVFQKCLSFCKVKYVLIHELANICQGCFKNGTSPGTRDYRWFAGLYLLLRIVIIAVIGQQYYPGPLFSIVVPCIMAVLVAILRPYRIDFYNKLDSVSGWFLQLAALGMCMYWLSKTSHQQ